MVKIYYDLIVKGLKTIDEVPSKLKKQVQALLDGESNDSQDSVIFYDKKRGE